MVEIDGVPVHNRRRDQAEAGRAEALVLEGAVAELTLPMEEDGAAQGIARLTDHGLAGWRRASVCSESYSRGHPEPDVLPLASTGGKIVRAYGSVRSQPLRPASPLAYDFEQIVR